MESNDRVVLEAALIADTRDGGEPMGFRNGGPQGRRMLFQADDVYVELLVPGEGTDTPDGGWLYGQFITPEPAAVARFQPPLHASLTGPNGSTGAARLTDVGDFAVPFFDDGAFQLDIEPASGPTIRVAFTH